MNTTTKQGDVALLDHPTARDVRLLRPTWVGVLDFETRFPAVTPS